MHSYTITVCIIISSSSIIIITSHVVYSRSSMAMALINDSPNPLSTTFKS